MVQVSLLILKRNKDAILFNSASARRGFCMSHLIEDYEWNQVTHDRALVNGVRFHYMIS